MENMEPAEREKLSDKLLSYLLFNPHHIEQIAMNELKKESGFNVASLSEEERELLKRISDKTRELYRKMGDNPLDNF